MISDVIFHFKWSNREMWKINYEFIFNAYMIKFLVKKQIQVN